MSGELLLYNGEIITVNEREDVAEALFVRDGKIVFVGKNDAAKKYITEKTELLDLHGCAVLPGFVDCHIHMAVSGFQQKNEIKLSDCKSVGDILERIERSAKDTDGSDWIICSGYNHEKLAEKRHVSRQELDGAALNLPVALVHSSGHMSVCNTKALEEVGLLKGTAAERLKTDIYMDKNGEATGLIKETAHFTMVKKSPIGGNAKELVLGIERFQGRMLKAGITSAHDAGGYGSETLRSLQTAKESGVLKCRTYPMIWTLYGKSEQQSLAKTFMESGFFTGLGDDRLKMGPIKLMADGSAVGGTCATRRPLLHTGKIMSSTFTQSELDEIFIEAHRLGFQLTAHAAGDKAVEMVLNSYEKSMKMYPRKDSRHRIEHCFICPPDLVARIRELRVLPIPNPGFLSVWGDVFEKYYGDRAEDVIPLKSFEENGIITPFGSDALVIEEFAPLFGIAAAIERMSLSSSLVICEKQRISLMRAIRCSTHFGAYASFEENIKGSLEKGKLADMVVLSDSLLDKTPEEIRSIKVERTYIGGECVYS